MNSNRLFNSIVAFALLFAIKLTVREAAATNAVTSYQDNQSQVVCTNLPSRYSIHNEYVEGLGWITYTEDGPIGVDGGLIDLLSKYRTCSR